ncbi:MAG TPA: hypothetical protein VMD53_16555 [Rhizomicrobium sp.]|nr:hypothetical protein [Rhizomicrobium sp.]
MTHFPETRLAKLAARPGGLMRDIAIENAMKSIESMRGEGDEAIKREMDEIDKIMAGMQKNRLPADQLKMVLHRADLIVTLAATFGYEPLARCMRSLCDVADGLLHNGLDDGAPVAVHVRSMRLLAPGSAVLSPPQVEVVLGELAKILTHYDFSPISKQADQIPIAK